MQETCSAVARISYSILSNRKEIKEPAEKLRLHLLNRPKMTSLSETLSKICMETVDNKQAVKPEFSPPNFVKEFHTSAEFTIQFRWG